METTKLTDLGFIMMDAGDQAAAAGNFKRRDLCYEIAKEYFRADIVNRLPPDKAGAFQMPGDTFNIKDSQIGAAGSSSTAKNNTFNQANNLENQNVDAVKLEQELGDLSKKILEKSTSPENVAAADAVTKAQIAAQNNDPEGVKQSLIGAGEVAMETATAMGAHEAAEQLRRAGIAPPEDLARIEFWGTSLPHERFLVEEEKLGDLAKNRILGNIERYGICLIRPVGHAVSRELVESVIEMIGTPTEWQNIEPGPIKDIRPKPGVDPNTGDSKGDLGFHVDGTQHVKQPPLLLFQYATGATLGAYSKFADAAKIINDIPKERRHKLLINLARYDAASFEKKGMDYKGPIVSFSDTNALMLRIRFDGVITVHPECKEDFEYLREKFDDPHYSIVFQPRDGDIVLFDNWRVMHARTEVYGTRDRHHRRVWFSNLRLEHQPKYYLGIRPIPRDVVAEIHARNQRPIA